MTVTKDVLDWINIGGAAVAAVFWIASALVKVPNLLESSLSGPNSITSVMKRMSALSALAALGAAASAGSQVWLKLWPPLS